MEPSPVRSSRANMITTLWNDKWRRHSGTLVLVATFLIAFIILFKPWVYGIDPVGYFSWLRSIVIDGDLNVGNELEHYGIGGLWEATPTQNTHNKYAIGSALLWSPAYFAVHGLSQLANGLGFPLATDGYAPLYIWAVSLTSAGYGFAAVIITYQVCRDYFTEAISILATLTAWLAGPLVFYMYSSPTMSHANDAFAFALFLFTWHRHHERQDLRSAGLIGATAALCALVRQQNAILVIPCIGDILISEILKWRKPPQSKAIKLALLRIITFSFSWWIVYTPQLIVWRIVFGRWIEMNPYGGGFNWLQPNVLSLLISSNHGLLVWNPFIVPAVLGWLPLWRRSTKLTSVLTASFVLQLYVVASWGAWSAGGAGQRFFTNLMPAFTLGLAALFSSLRTDRARQGSVACSVGLMLWNAMLILRYVLEDIPRIGSSISHRDLFIGQFTVIPRYLNRIIEILMTRQ